MPAPRDQMKGVLKELGRRIAAARKEKALSQEDVAWQVGIHTNHLSMIERGVANPSVAVLIAVADAIGIDAKELVGNLPKRRKRRQ